MDEGVAILKGEEIKANARMQARIKSLFNMLFDFAVEYELADKTMQEPSRYQMKREKRSTPQQKTTLLSVLKKWKFYGAM